MRNFIESAHIPAWKRIVLGVVAMGTGLSSNHPLTAQETIPDWTDVIPYEPSFDSYWVGNTHVHISHRDTGVALTAFCLGNRHNPTNREFVRIEFRRKGLKPGEKSILEMWHEENNETIFVEIVRNPNIPEDSWHAETEDMELGNITFHERRSQGNVVYLFDETTQCPNPNDP